MKRTLVTAVILCVAACSHGSGKSAFVSSAGKVCDDSAHEIDVAYSAQLNPTSSIEQVSYFLAHTLVPVYRTRSEKLRAVMPPDADQATVSAILDDEAKVVDAIAANPDDFANQKTDPFGPSKTRWDQYGVHACGSG